MVRDAMALMTFKYAIYMIFIFSSLLLAMTLIPDDDTQVSALTSAPELCAGACLFGIQPGITTVSDSLLFLHSHDWIGRIYESVPGNGYAQITWDWSGHQPDVIDNNRSGRITFYWDEENPTGPTWENSIIDTISIYTHARIYLLQNWLGTARSGNASFRPDGSLAYSINYDMPGGTLNLTADMHCPIDVLSYWKAPTRLSMSIGRSTSRFVNLVDLIKIC